MKPSKLDANQILKVVKAGAYVAVSALVGSLLSAITDNPELFGAFTVFVNIILVFIKQLFTPTGK